VNQTSINQLPLRN